NFIDLMILNDLHTAAAKAEVFDLHGWCRQAITVASTDSVYGPLNPYRVEGIEDAFWDYEGNLTPLLMNIIPSLTARKAWTAREKIMAEFIKFYKADGHQNSSALAHGRWKAQHDHAAIRDDCVLLVSIFQEMLRLGSGAAPARFVNDDILLGNKYFSQKGAMLQMPAQCLNLEKSRWGNDAKEFNPRRFMKKAKLRSTGEEILAVVAMMFLRYDISPVGGFWKEPKLNGYAIASSMGPLAEEFPATFTAREEFEGVQWRFNVTEGKGRFSLVVG
ncbi:hypothetical protein N7540_003499, partial [Penicillium herquei]